MIHVLWVLLLNAALLIAGLFGVTRYSSLDEAGRQEADRVAQGWAKQLARNRRELLGQDEAGPLAPPYSEDFRD